MKGLLVILMRGLILCLPASLISLPRDETSGAFYEPAIMLLFGTCLIGLSGFARKKYSSL
jgi:hypothetical protein